MCPFKLLPPPTPVCPPHPWRGSGAPGCSRPVRPLCQGRLGPVRLGAWGQRHPGQGRVPVGAWGPSLSRAFRAEPPHDGSIRALKPAGLPALGRDPAPPSAPWPCSPLSAAAAPETLSQELPGKPSHRVFPSPHHLALPWTHQHHMDPRPLVCSPPTVRAPAPPRAGRGVCGDWGLPQTQLGPPAGLTLPSQGQSWA